MGAASLCVDCKACIPKCPQKIEIPDDIPLPEDLPDEPLLAGEGYVELRRFVHDLSRQDSMQIHQTR